ncbi:hypothetical protein B9479_005988 [Cryptococcus floricola]|uniref:Golgi apparatus membrane protein TVP38 n=1 Tax=Cryptococcus floricola TaxID=2591691 RepID=A0A5D3ARR5_9TREE|nr:hypothetical protein B9479_005988 [Cryptococcus floricola]
MDDRPPISHPYPPDHFARPQGLDYQRRRDERHANSDMPAAAQAYPPAYLGDNPYAEMSRGPSPNLGVQQPLYGSSPAPMMRSASSSSAQPLADPERGEANSASRSKEGDYPEGWTKEDEEEERQFLSQGMIDWNELKQWRYWIRKEWWFWYILGAVGIVLVCLMSLYHDEIVDWLRPVADWMKDLTAGWTIPIAVFFVLSFPPLFGHEIVAVLCGVVWGLWEGFGITSAGTLLGEIGNFYAFKYCLKSHAEKYEKNNMNYACLAHVVREGGFFIIFVVRLSAIPGHFTTAVFATCGMNIWIFTLAAILTLPKQASHPPSTPLIVVYLGVLFDDTESSSKEKWISRGVLIGGFLITIASAWYIWREMHKVRPIVWRRRKIEAAAKGMSLDPKTGKFIESPHAGMDGLAATGKEWENALRPGRAGEEDDARSPILVEHEREQAREREDGYRMDTLGMDDYRGQRQQGRLERHQSYQNPYDISYQNSNQMSIYDVDGPQVHEQDIAYGYKPASSTDTFLPTYNAQPPPPSHGTHLHPHQPSAHQLTHPSPPAQNQVSFPEAHSTGVEDQHTGAGAGLHRHGTGATVYAKEEPRVGWPQARPNMI